MSDQHSTKEHLEHTGQAVDFENASSESNINEEFNENDFDEDEIERQNVKIRYNLENSIGDQSRTNLNEPRVELGPAQQESMEPSGQEILQPELQEGPKALLLPIILVKSPELVQQEDPELVRLEDPEPVRQEDPEPVRQENPEPVRQEDPEPARQEDPVQQEDPEPGRQEDPEPGRQEDPEPARQEDPELARQGYSKPVWQQEVQQQDPETTRQHGLEPAWQKVPESVQHKSSELVRRKHSEMVKEKDPEGVKQKHPEGVHQKNFGRESPRLSKQWIQGIAIVSVLAAASLGLYFLLFRETQILDSRSVLQIFQDEFKSLQKAFPDQSRALWLRSEKMLRNHLNKSHPDEPAILILTAAQDAKHTLLCLGSGLAQTYAVGLNASWVVIYGPSKSTYDDSTAKLYIDLKLSSGFQSNSRSAVIHRLETLPPGSLLILYKYCDHENAAYKNVALVFTVLLEDSSLDPDTPLPELEEKVRDFLWQQFISSGNVRSHQEMDSDKLSGVWSRISHLVLPVLPVESIEAGNCPFNHNGYND